MMKEIETFVNEIKKILNNCKIDEKTGNYIITSEDSIKIASLYIFNRKHLQIIIERTYNALNNDIKKTPINMRPSPDSQEWGNIIEKYFRIECNKFFREMTNSDIKLFNRGDPNTQYDFMDNVFDGIFHTEIKASKDGNGWYGPHYTNCHNRLINEGESTHIPTKYSSEYLLRKQVYTIFLNHKMILKQHNNENIVTKLEPQKAYIAFMSVENWQHTKNATNGSITNKQKDYFFYDIYEK